ncbi:acyl-coenzyme A--6-aminopenicillanic-acid-acyltransferase form [Streptomyces alfalfae]|uniref:Acyl-coenzyme A--6-aminopenicillanic-acid-acyltransferase form n=1 Tax=Streptomyces alfalfae TaxID=1642299 RepID=A0ABN4VMJ7_9ACTN|nr:C45 family peptidase [Streptomyces alfalfae]APY86980.1 acyl-coenzyme A--6-aminopenicillanic-acid-acyltransferase form [Streptomyces alfalfae]AYA17372.1 acyl-coenzyme A--6-aminopenicillanic-acid-acyltransferase form [Streptomyces fradiae]RXX37120.1 acyl-coenzyme A--6-aminopenicillanic-acid-acyltransferase form [Streptomyces alfalfae]RZM87374.1 acyl-coenzyme A--6-aminopenicillanic-acid-acyltransferase form [Streptomyces alfalfae]
MAPRTLPVIEISGTPTERGRQYGESVRPRIRAAIGYYEEAFGHSAGLTWDRVTARAARWLDPVSDYAPHLVEEMRGIADGAGVTLLDVLALNARGEVIYDRSFADMAEASPAAAEASPGAADEEPAEGCTSFAAYGAASGDGHVYAGQNWDWRAGVADTVVMIRVVQPPKPTLIMQVEAGQIGRQGANSAGIALNANGLGGRFDDAIGLPQTVVRRSVLDRATITDALDVLCRTRAHIASNALLTCREGFAIDLETTPAGHGWMYPADGLLVHGNHYQAGVPAALADGYRPMSSDSLVRVPRAEEGLRALRASTGPDESRKLIKQAMSDHLGLPESLCTHPDPRRPAVKHWATLVSSCVDLTTGDYHVTAGTPCDRDYQHMPWNLYDGPYGESS